MGHPDQGPFAHAPSFSQTMGRNVLLQQDRQLHALHMRQHERNSIRSFRFHAHGFFHSLRFPTFRFCVQMEANREELHLRKHLANQIIIVKGDISMEEQDIIKGLTLVGDEYKIWDSNAQSAYEP